MRTGVEGAFVKVLGLRGYKGIIGCIYIYIYILVLYRDNGKENGNYYLGFRVYA